MSIPFAGGYLSFTKWGPFAVPRFIKVTPGNKKKATPEVEIVGLKDAVLSHKTESGTALTETTFDTVTRPDEARILFTNASGASQTITACWIRGKLVKKVGGDSGYTHDSHVDYEAIARDGENKFELGNDWIVTLTQVNKLADYHWKYNKTKKHIYTVSLAGVQSWFEPGEWYQLTIGAAGTAEYIDSVVECYSVRTSYNATGSFGTQVSFREVEENWKFDSNATARYVAAGGHSRVSQGRITTIAAAGYPGYADYYCPGTSDDAAVIQDAIDKTTGGTLQFTAGEYSIYSTLRLNKSDLSLYGESMQTVFSRYSAGTTDESLIVGSTEIAEPASSQYIENNIVTGIHFQGSSSDAVQFAVVRLRGTKNTLFETNKISRFVSQNGLYASYNTFGTIAGNVVDGDGGGGFGIVAGGDYLNVLGNEVLNCDSTRATGIVGIGVSGRKCIVAENHIHDCVSISTTAVNGGIYGLQISGDDNVLKSNVIENMTSTGGTTDNYAAWVSGGRNILDSNIITSNDHIGLYVSTGATNTKLNNNYCFNNGTDTGLANTNQRNFLDQGVDTQVG